MSATAKTSLPFALVACVRWDEQHIQEWLEYHRAVGFDHVFLYSDDDDPTALLKAAGPYLFGPNPFVTLRHWPVMGRRTAMRLHFLRTFKERTGWFAFLEADEFLVFKGGDDVARFMRRFEETADCVAFNCFNYGNNAKIRRDDAPVLTSHLRRAALADARAKTICRASAIDERMIEAAGREGGAPFWEAPDGGASLGLRCVNAAGEPLDGRARAAQAGGEAAQAPEGLSERLLQAGYVAHFRFKSEDDFLRRHARGLPEDAGWKAVYESGAHRAILDRDNAVYDTYLAGFWSRWTARATDYALRVPPEDLPAPNVALNKPSWQSSVYEPDGKEPEGSSPSGGGNNGLRTGTYGFHTRREESPWWAVDLLGAFDVLEVRVYNRLDNRAAAARANELDILVSMDASSWTVIYSRTDAEPFGGADGRPVSVKLAQPAPARFVALRLRSSGFLHLDEVEVYGLPSQGGG